MNSRYYVRKGRGRSGASVYRVAYRDDQGKERTFPGSTVPLKRDAQRQAESLNAQLRVGDSRTAAERRTTFAAYASRYVRDKAAGIDGRAWSASTTAGNRRVLERDVLPYLGHHPLTLLEGRPEVIRSWAADLAERGLERQTIKTRVGLVAAILRRAVLDGFIVRNPADGLNVVVAPKQMLERVDPVDVFRIRAHLPIRYWPAVTLQLGAGLRIGEALAVTPEDLSGGAVRVSKQTHDPSDLGGGFRPPKGGAHGVSDRTVPVDGRLVAELLEWVDLYGVSDQGTIVANSVGGLVHQGRYSTTWAKARKASAEEAVKRDLRPVPRIVPHDLRAWWITSLLADRGLPTDLVARMAGHSVLTLERHYRRWIPDRESQFSEAVQGLWSDLGRAADGITRT